MGKTRYNIDLVKEGNMRGLVEGGKGESVKEKTGEGQNKVGDC